jgi:hypothetical protein
MDKDLKPKRNTNRLDRLSTIRAEMAKLYRRMRNGKLTSEEGSRLVRVLREIAEVVKTETELDIGERLARLEEQRG